MFLPTVSFSAENSVTGLSFFLRRYAHQRFLIKDKLDLSLKCKCCPLYSVILLKLKFGIKAIILGQISCLQKFFHDMVKKNYCVTHIHPNSFFSKADLPGMRAPHFQHRQIEMHMKILCCTKNNDSTSHGCFLKMHALISNLTPAECGSAGSIIANAGISYACISYACISYACISYGYTFIPVSYRHFGAFAACLFF